MNSEGKRFLDNEKEEILAHYADKIYEYIRLTNSLYLLYKSSGFEEYPPCSTNLRDAIFHFCKLYESDFEEEAILQYSAIDEHLNRMFKDSLIKYLKLVLKRFEDLYEAENGKQGVKQKLQKSIHELKNLEIELRIQSMNIDRLEKETIYEQFERLMTEDVCKMLKKMD
ncbi:MAG: hypothetical protein RR614_00790 [Eubacterium sp.]